MNLLPGVLETELIQSTSNLSKELSVLFGYLKQLESINGVFVQAGVIYNDGTFHNANHFSIYRYTVSEGDGVFVVSKLVSKAVTSSRSLCFAYNGDTAVTEAISAVDSNGKYKYAEYTVPAGVDNICVYNSDDYSQYVGLVKGNGEIDVIKGFIEILNTSVSDLHDDVEEIRGAVIEDITYTSDDKYVDEDGWAGYFTTLSGGIGTTLPNPSKYPASATYWGTMTKPVKQGQKIYLASRCNDSPRAWMWALTDKDKKIVSVAEQGTFDTRENPLELTVTEYGYVVINFSPNVSGLNYLRVTGNKVKIIEEYVSDIADNLNTLQTEVEDNLNTLQTEVEENDLSTAVPDITASGEYIRYDNGTTTTTEVAASRIHDTYNVEEGDVYSIKMNSIGNVGAAIAFFDSAGDYVKKCSIQGVTGNILRLVIVVPKGVATMHICYIAPAIYVKKAIGVPSKSSAEDISDVDYLPATPLEIVKDTPGYAAIFHRIGVIGGSFATGAQDYDLPTVDNTGILENSVIQRLAAMYGGTAFNFSAGGMSARRWLTNKTIGGQSTKFTDNLVQGYFIQLGNNDLNDHYKDNTYELGTIDDVHVGNESENPDTFYGNLSKVIGRIRDVQPNAYVFILTFVRGYNNQSYGTTIPPEFDYNPAIRQVYQKYRAAADLPKGERTETLRFLLIDYYTYGKDWTFFRTGIHLNAYRRTHLSPTGYQYQAYEFATYIDWLIKKDMEYFNDVAFVGTDKRTRDD